MHLTAALVARLRGEAATSRAPDLRARRLQPDAMACLAGAMHGTAHLATTQTLRTMTRSGVVLRIC